MKFQSNFLIFIITFPTILIIAGLSIIGTGTAMENAQIMTEDVVEEHNGVYSDKWYIVSPKGFDYFFKINNINKILISLTSDFLNFICRY